MDNLVTHSFKSNLLSIVALFVLMAMISAFTPMTSQGQGGTSSKDVVVVNTPSNPIPMVAQGATKVVVSNPVEIGDTQANPIHVREADTVLVFDGTLNGPEFSSPLDVSEFKQIRVVANRISGANTYRLQLRILDSGNSLVAPLDELLTTDHPFLTEVYEIPGQLIQVAVLQTLEGSAMVRVQVYGRSN